MVKRPRLVAAASLCLALVFFLGLVLPLSATNADYRFTVDRNISRVFVNEDASIDVEYWLTFTCDRGARPIDIIDVGMPSGDYILSSIEADMNGTPLRDIRKSEFLRHGVEVHLGRNSIQPGASGTLHLRARVTDRVFPDSDDDNYASVVFSPTWYDGDFAHGVTVLQFSLFFPPGVQPEEPRYHGEPFTEASVEGDSVVYTWTLPDARPDRQYTFGASFPRQYVDRVASPPLFDMEELIGLAVCAVFVLVGMLFVGGIVLAVRTERRRRLEYLPPSLAVEGVEVRRGLTAPEAAVLMSQPLNKVLTLVSFGLISKNAMRVLGRDPLRVEALKPAPAGLQPYETAFLEAIGADGRLDERRLRALSVDLVQRVNNKMKGFNRGVTIAYYRSIIDKAWEKVKTADEGDLSDELLAETVEWTSLDRDFERKAPEIWVGRTFRRPIWWGNYSPHHRPAPRGGGGGQITLPDISMPRLPGSEFANSMVSGLEGMASSVVGNIESFTSGVTKVTNPPPVSSSSSRGGGRSSGGGCACACACAGCACACAGGGR
jgi:hypothetical protein